jgi:glutathione synthase/RimK-type ligase-like ATP-grasp enzyme
MRVAIASFRGLPEAFQDDERLAAQLRGRGVDVHRIPWDEPEARWEDFDAVVIRSTWDYAQRRDEFLAWAERLDGRLHNSPAVVRWNSDKRYLRDLAAAGLPVVETTFVEPGDEPPELAGEVVVKPNVSAGARDTGRFSPATHDEALRLIRAIQDSGRVALVQPYEPSVETRGETAVVCLDGEVSHPLHKRAILRPDEVAPAQEGAIAADVMFDPNLVTAGSASAEELELAQRIVDHISARFDYVPLYARVDMIADGDGTPMLLELEALEPNLYLDQVEGAAEKVADAIIRRAKHP